MAQYKCIPAPRELVIDEKGNFDNAVRDFADLINKEAKEGWEFYSMEDIVVTQKGGCLTSLLALIFKTAADTKIHFNMLVFVKK